MALMGGSLQIGLRGPTRFGSRSKSHWAVGLGRGIGPWLPASSASLPCHIWRLLPCPPYRENCSGVLSFKTKWGK